MLLSLMWLMTTCEIFNSHGVFCTPITSLNLLDLKESFGKFIIKEQGKKNNKNTRTTFSYILKQQKKYIYNIDRNVLTQEKSAQNKCSRSCLVKNVHKDIVTVWASALTHTHTYTLGGIVSVSWLLNLKMILHIKLKDDGIKSVINVHRQRIW